MGGGFNSHSHLSLIIIGKICAEKIGTIWMNLLALFIVYLLLEVTLHVYTHKFYRVFWMSR